MAPFETSGGVHIGGRRASWPLAKMRVDATTLSITSPIASIAFSPREVIDLRTSRLGRTLEVVHTHDGRKVTFVRRDPEELKAQILATGFRPAGVPGGGPDPARAAERREEDRVDRKRLGFLAAIIAVPIVLGGGALVFGLVFAFKDSEAYKTSLALVASDARVTDVTGTPLTSGEPTGSIEVNGESGHAVLVYPVTGPRGKAQVHVEATKALGRWTIDGLAVDPDGDDAKRIELVVPTRGEGRSTTL